MAGHCWRNICAMGKNDFFSWEFKEYLFLSGKNGPNLKLNPSYTLKKKEEKWIVSPKTICYVWNSYSPVSLECEIFEKDKLKSKKKKYSQHKGEQIINYAFISLKTQPQMRLVCLQESKLNWWLFCQVKMWVNGINWDA